jgi:hypothetical protein
MSGSFFSSSPFNSSQPSRPTHSVRPTRFLHLAACLARLSRHHPPLGFSHEHMLRSLASGAVVPPGLHSHRRRRSSEWSRHLRSCQHGQCSPSTAPRHPPPRPSVSASWRPTHLRRPPSRRRPSMALLHPLESLLAEPRTRVTSVYVSGVQDGIDLLLHNVFDSGCFSPLFSRIFFFLLQ